MLFSFSCQSNLNLAPSAADEANRLPLMMAAPLRTEDAPEEEQTFVYVEPRAGDVVMWESFVRHEVPPNEAKRARISVSFNYSW